ncbi:MAG: hypothetical protein WCO56_21970 [Verrucomicrobiota bacterium]
MFLVLAVGTLTVGLLPGCKPSAHVPDQTLVLAPPAPPDDSRQGTNLATPPKDAIVFDLKYLVQRGGANEISYHSYWGFGSSQEEANKQPFIQAVQKRVGKISYVNNGALKGREWSALELDGKKILALYFDVNGDGKLSDNERLLPNKIVDGDGAMFITPDFTTTLPDGRQVLFRALLEARFYSGNSEPNCMWSPACLLSGTSTINGKPAQLLLFANGFSGEFSRYGSCSHAILLGEKVLKTEYVPRETLSSLIHCEDQFYHLQFDGQRASGHPARAILTRDANPTGSLVPKLLTAKPVETTFNNLYIQGAEDKTIYFNLRNAKEKLPKGAYVIQRGYFSFGPASGLMYEANFTQGPKVSVAADKPTEVVLGEPTLVVRAIKESERYAQSPTNTTVFKKGTRLYFEPQIVGRNKELFSGFKNRKTDKDNWVNTPPQVTITGPDGKVLLTKTMEYG